jgi:hypothetical protein
MNRRTQSAFKILGVVLALANASVAAGDEQASLTWTTGMEFSSGKYGGAEVIEDLYVPITARLDYQRFTFELTVPYLSVRAPSGSTITEPGGEPVAGSGELSTESGLGDVIAGVTVYDVFYSDDLGVALDVTGKIKFGTADEVKGLGTGGQDYTVRADLFKFYEHFTLLGSAGYKFRGDTADLDLEDVFIGSLGGVYTLNEKRRFGLMYDYRESALIDGDAISELSAFTASRINDSLQIQFYAFTGFSDSSADWGAGFLLQIL